MAIERWMLVVRRRIRTLFGGEPLDRELEDELRDHIECQVDAHVAAGMSREAARAEALRALGGLEQRKEECRDARGWRLARTAAQDLRFALTTLRRRPAFAVAATTTLGLAIGANTAIFAVVNGVLLQPLPFPEPERLMLVSSAPSDPLFGRALGLSEQHFLDFREGQTPFEHVATFGRQPAVLSGAGEPRRIAVAPVSAGFFATLGVPPALGRTLAEGDDDSSRDRTVVISDGLWRGSFGATPDAIGRLVTIDGVNHHVVGVMPPGFAFPDEPDAWTPLAIVSQAGNSLTRPVIGRLRPGMTPTQAQSQLQVLAPAPSDSSTWETVVLPLKERTVGRIRRPLMVLAAAVAFILLVACANVANLFLVRMEERQRELAVRVALGAGRRRLLQQLFVEAGLVAFLGVGLGVLLASWALPVLIALAPAGSIPHLELVRLDGAVLVFAGVLGVVTALGFGLLPAFRATGGGGALALAHRTHTRRYERLHGSFVVAEIALSLILLTGAGLMLKSFMRLQGIETGFATDNVLTATVDLPAKIFDAPETAQAFHSSALERLDAVPGVRAAGAVNWLPFGTMSLSGDLHLDAGRPLPPDYQVDKPAVSSGYFDAMGIGLLAGRFFTEQDGSNAQPVAIVSRSVASELWAGEDAIGKRLSLRSPRSPADWLTVVGVVDDVTQQSLTRNRSRAVYQPYLQVRQLFFLTHMTYVVRTDLDPTGVSPAIRAALRSVDPTIPVPSIVPMDAIVVARTAAPAFQARLLSLFAAVALTLTVVGIYAVLAYSVSQRTREFGIRMALGAHTANVLRLVLGRTAVLAAAGIVLGTAGAVVLTRLLAQLLFEVTPTDPATFGSVMLLLAGAAVVAAAVPAWRASRVDPTTTLRAE